MYTFTKTYPIIDSNISANLLSELLFNSKYLNKKSETLKIIQQIRNEAEAFDTRVQLKVEPDARMQIALRHSDHSKM